MSGDLYRRLVCYGAELEGAGAALRVKVSEVSRPLILAADPRPVTLEDADGVLWYVPDWRRAKP